MKENSKLVLIGGGGHCKSVLSTIIQSNVYSEVVITDCNIPTGTRILGCKVVGGDEILPKLFKEGFKDAVITIGSIKSTDKRRQIFLLAKRIGFSFPSIIDHSATIAFSGSIAEGVYVGKNAVVNADAVIGSMAIINTGAIIEHDCRIGEFTHIAVGATVCGGTQIERDVLIGANAVVVQKVKIGRNSIIGAGAIVFGDVPEYRMVFGQWGGDKK